MNHLSMPNPGTGLKEQLLLQLKYCQYGLKPHSFNPLLIKRTFSPIENYNLLRNLLKFRNNG